VGNAPGRRAVFREVVPRRVAHPARWNRGYGRRQSYASGEWVQARILLAPL
jgi:hypothetical protein